MRHYFVAGSEKKVMDMIRAFLYAYNVHIIDIHSDREPEYGTERFWGHVDFDNMYTDIDPRSDGKIHFDREVEIISSYK